MALQCTPPNLCCINPQTQAVQCYDPAKCQICNEVTGAVTTNDPDVLKKECKKCIVDKDGNAQTPTFCDDPTKEECCGGVCWNASYTCQQCVESFGIKKLISYTEKVDTGCCLHANNLQDGKVSWTGVGEYKISENKCKQCISGALVDRLPPTNQRCCEETGEFVDKCYNCDGTSILSPQQKQQCVKCENGILEGPNSACTGNQTCCNGQCCDPDDCCGGKCTTNTGCSYCGYAESLINRCSDPDWNIGVNNPNSNQYGKDTCCGPENDISSQAPRYVCWDPITERCKKCVDGHLIDKCDSLKEDCCPNGECRKKSDECTVCDNSSTVGGIIQKVIAGQVCCENNMVPETSCCNGQILEQNQGCCGNTVYNSIIYDCCNNIFTFKKGEEDCCDLGNGNRTTYNKRDQECCGNAVIWKALEGCCNGVPYGKTCQTCIENTIVLNYDTECYGCIESGSLARSSGKYSKCKENNKSCCSAWSKVGDAAGICYDPNNCDTCIPGEEENKVEIQCEEPLKCCGKSCWNPNDPADKCKKCVFDYESPNSTKKIFKLIDKCSTPTFFGERDQECCPGNDVTPSECWTPRLNPCSECTPEGVKPTRCKDSANVVSGTTACCGSYIGEGEYECYNDTCHGCVNGIVGFKLGYVESCPHTDGNTYCCKTGEYCASGKCCPEGKINCMNTCCDPDKCIDGLCCPTDCGAKNSTTCYEKSECCAGSVINPSIEKCCTKSDKEYASVALSEFKCPLEDGCCGNTCCDKTCCNNKDCCDEQCCEGPYGGCYSGNACQECQNGQVTDKCGEYGDCCAGVCYYPSKCETCVAGVVQPPTFSSFCNCINRVEICECPIAGLRIEIDTENTGHCCDAATFKVKLVSALSGQGSIIGSVNLNNSDSCTPPFRQITVSDNAASDLLNNLVGQDCCNFRIELICDPTGFGAFQPFGPDQCHTSIANGRVFKTLSNGSEALIWSGYLDNTGAFNICDETLLP